MKTRDKLNVGGYFHFEWKGLDGLKKEWDSFNKVVDVGLQYLLDSALLGTTPISSWYMGLTAGTPTIAAGDILGTHTGWTEVTTYSESTRQAWTGVRSSQTISNTASKAVFTFASGTTLGGAFLCSQSNKASTTGTLLSGSAFSGGNEVFSSGGTLTVTYTFAASSST
jgi:hypothetical protein